MKVRGFAGKFLSVSIKRCGILLLLLLSSLSSFAAVPSLDLASHHGRSVVGYVEVLAVDSRRDSLESVMNTDLDDDWLLLADPSVVLEMAFEPVWLRFRLTNSSNRSRQVYFHINYADLIELDLYKISNGNIIEQYSTGTSKPFETREMPFADYAFSLVLKPGEERDVYARVRSEGNPIIPMSLWNTDDFARNQSAMTMWNGVFYGVLLVLAFYYLMTWVYLRSPTYLAMMSYILCLGGMALAMTGEGYQYIWTYSPKFNIYAAKIFTWLLIVSSLAFILSIYEIRDRKRGLYHLIMTYLFLVSTILLFNMWHPSSLTQILLTACFGAAMVGWVCFAVVAFRSRSRVSIFFVLSFGFLFGGGLTVLVARYAGFEYAVYFLDIYKLGTIVGVLLQAAAVIEQIREQQQQAMMMRDEVHQKDQQIIKYREQALVQEKAVSEALEIRVKRRTRELTRAMEKLSRSNRMLEEQSNIDPLTEVMNRRYFDARFETEWQRAYRNQHSITLLIIDLDDFKAINDTHGHVAGDEVLRAVAACLMDCMQRSTDVVARYGGDEFALIMAETEVGGASVVAEKIRIRIQALRIKFGTTDLTIKVSIGVLSAVPDILQGWRRALIMADKSLYASKSSGRNKVTVRQLIDTTF
ncbi:MAG: diguanylate cyclase [Pseudomonadales bacterium]